MPTKHNPNRRRRWWTQLAASVLENPWIPHEPTLPQAEFLLLPHREILYGGAAGGGKSEALLMAALQYVEKPGYAAILFRRTFADLALPGALMSRAHEWLSPGADWSERAKRWTFPSGATLSFGYLDSLDDRYRYQGAEFQFVGVDELTQHREDAYRFLFSRLRRLAGSSVPLRMRAASNPGGVGHEWVKRRFVTHGCHDRAFVPARLVDNPFLDHSEYVRSLGALDPITRAQLLEGDWDAAPGGEVFQPRWFRYWRWEDGRYRVGDDLIDPAECWRFGSVDLAVAQHAHADYTVIAAWAVTMDGRLLLVDLLRARMPAPEIIPALRRMSAKHGLDYLAIERTGFQEAIVQLARRQGLSVKPLTPTGDKRSRALAAAVRYEAGSVFHSSGAPWLEEFEAELVRFTGDDRLDAHDDQVDVTSYACLEVARRFADPANRGENDHPIE